MLLFNISLIPVKFLIELIDLSQKFWLDRISWLPPSLGDIPDSADISIDYGVNEIPHMYHIIIIDKNMNFFIHYAAL